MTSKRKAEDELYPSGKSKQLTTRPSLQAAGRPTTDKYTRSMRQFFLNKSKGFEDITGANKPALQDLLTGNVLVMHTKNQQKEAQGKFYADVLIDPRLVPLEKSVLDREVRKISYEPVELELGRKIEGKNVPEVFEADPTLLFIPGAFTQAAEVLRQTSIYNLGSAKTVDEFLAIWWERIGKSDSPASVGIYPPLSRLNPLSQQENWEILRQYRVAITDHRADEGGFGRKIIGLMVPSYWMPTLSIYTANLERVYSLLPGQEAFLRSLPILPKEYDRWWVPVAYRIERFQDFLDLFLVFGNETQSDFVPGEVFRSLQDKVMSNAVEGVEGAETWRRFVVRPEGYDISFDIIGSPAEFSREFGCGDGVVIPLHQYVMGRHIIGAKVIVQLPVVEEDDFIWTNRSNAPFTLMTVVGLSRPVSDTFTAMRRLTDPYSAGRFAGPAKTPFVPLRDGIPPKYDRPILERRSSVENFPVYVSLLLDCIFSVNADCSTTTVPESVRLLFVEDRQFAFEPKGLSAEREQLQYLAHSAWMDGVTKGLELLVHECKESFLKTGADARFVNLTPRYIPGIESVHQLIVFLRALWILLESLWFTTPVATIVHTSPDVANVVSTLLQDFSPYMNQALLEVPITTEDGSLCTEFNRGLPTQAPMFYPPPPVASSMPPPPSRRGSREDLFSRYGSGPSFPPSPTPQPSPTPSFSQSQQERLSVRPYQFGTVAQSPSPSLSQYPALPPTPIPETSGFRLGPSPSIPAQEELGALGRMSGSSLRRLSGRSTVSPSPSLSQYPPLPPSPISETRGFRLGPSTLPSEEELVAFPAGVGRFSARTGALPSPSVSYPSLAPDEELGYAIQSPSIPTSSEVTAFPPPRGAGLTSLPIPPRTAAGLSSQSQAQRLSNLADISGRRLSAEELARLPYEPIFPQVPVVPIQPRRTIIPETPEPGTQSGAVGLRGTQLSQFSTRPQFSNTPVSPISSMISPSYSVTPPEVQPTSFPFRTMNKPPTPSASPSPSPSPTPSQLPGALSTAERRRLALAQLEPRSLEPRSLPVRPSQISQSKSPFGRPSARMSESTASIESLSSGESGTEDESALSGSSSYPSQSPYSYASEQRRVNPPRRAANQAEARIDAIKHFEAAGSQRSQSNPVPEAIYLPAFPKGIQR